MSSNGNSKPKFFYYKASGRGNQIRLALAAGGLEWEEEHAAAYPPTPEEKANWRELGGNTTTNVPMLVWNGNVYCQSSAILRHIGRETGLVPTNTAELYQMDKIIADAEDLRVEGYKSLPEWNATQDTMNHFIDVILPTHLENFERQLASSGDSSWFAGGSNLTIADCTAYDSIICFGTNRVPECSLDKFPKLQAWKKRVESNPGIAKYQASSLYESLWKFAPISKK